MQSPKKTGCHLFNSVLQGEILKRPDNKKDLRVNFLLNNFIVIKIGLIFIHVDCL